MLHDSQFFYPKIFNPLQLGSTWAPYTWCEDKPTCQKFVFFVYMGEHFFQLVISVRVKVKLGVIVLAQVVAYQVADLR